jgi:hypothetical protein
LKVETKAISRSENGIDLHTQGVIDFLFPNDVKINQKKPLSGWSG